MLERGGMRLGYRRFGSERRTWLLQNLTYL